MDALASSVRTGIVEFSFNLFRKKVDEFVFGFKK